MITITLPDGSVRSYSGPVTGLDVAKDIGPGLAKAALGGKVGDSILVKIKENEVVLKGPLGSEVLRMTPDVNKKTVVEVPKPVGRRNQRGDL